MITLNASGTYYDTITDSVVNFRQMRVFVREGRELYVRDFNGRNISQETLVKLAVPYCSHELFLEVMAKYVPYEEIENAVVAGGFREHWRRNDVRGI